MVVFSDPDIPDISENPAYARQWAAVPKHQLLKYELLRDKALSFKDIPGETGQAYYRIAKGQALTQLAKMRQMREDLQKSELEASDIGTAKP